mgnify:FL=1
MAHTCTLYVRPAADAEAVVVAGFRVDAVVVFDVVAVFEAAVVVCFDVEAAVDFVA